jgi:hypothetical protein
MEPKTIKIDNVMYVREDSVPALQKTSGKIRIVILQRGWVAVGYYSQEGSQCELNRASIIRVWGTTKGLGEIAYSGPTSKTVLDPCPPIKFHEMTVIATLDCAEAKWETKLL